MKDVVLGLASGHFDLAEGDMRYATAATTIDLALGAIGIKTHCVRLEEKDDPNFAGLAEDLRRGFFDGVVIANVCSDSRGETVELPVDKRMKRIAQVAAREVRPIFVQTPLVKTELDKVVPEAEIVAIGDNLATIKHILGGEA